MNGWTASGAGILLVALAILPVACTSQTSGTPKSTPVDSSQDVTPTVAPIRLSPPITARFLDLSAVVKDPCGLIPESFMAQYGPIVPGQLYPSSEGIFCKYQATATFDNPYVTAGVNNKSGGLEGLYARKVEFPVFEPGALLGYPTVRTLNAKSPGICSIDVAVNDAELLSVYVDMNPGQANYDNPCATTLPILTEALRRAGA